MCDVYHRSPSAYDIKARVEVNELSLFLCVFAGGDVTISSLDPFQLNSTQNSSCISLSVAQNTIIEDNKYFTISLVQGDIEVDFVNSQATITLIDDDGKINDTLIYVAILSFYVGPVKACVLARADFITLLRPFTVLPTSKIDQH